MNATSFEQFLFLTLGLLKSAVYTAEYNSLIKITKIFSNQMTPPKEHKDKELLNILLKELYLIHKLDAQKRSEKVYIVKNKIIDQIKNHIINIPHVFRDSLEVSKKRHQNNFKLNDKFENIPEYHHRNFHFQTNGYFSDESAKVYDHQVEILFSGTAQVMRRLIIDKIKAVKDFNHPIKILEIGGGTGNMIEIMNDNFNVYKYVFTEPSENYLNLANKNNTKAKNVEYFNFYGEALNLNDNEYDLVFSIYLFHEIPQSIREKVLNEMKRVCKADGIIAIADSIQLDDDPRVNTVLKDFPKDYHEPFYNDYLKWDAKKAFDKSNLNLLSCSYNLLTKYWILNK